MDIIKIPIGARQWIEIVFLPPSDKRLQDCHAYYIYNKDRTEKRGLFGTIYIRNDWKGYKLKGLLDHELQHFYNDYFDEQMATLSGKVSERFWSVFEE